MGTPVRLLDTAPSGFCFGALFYEALVWKSCKAPMHYSNMTHRESVYEAHGVRCANVLCTPVLSLVERTGAVYDDKRTRRKKSGKPPPANLS